MTDSDEQVARWVLLGAFLFVALLCGFVAIAAYMEDPDEDVVRGAVGNGFAIGAGLCVVAASIVFVGRRSRQ